MHYGKYRIFFVTSQYMFDKDFCYFRGFCTLPHWIPNLKHPEAARREDMKNEGTNTATSLIVALKQSLLWFYLVLCLILYCVLCVSFLHCV